MKQTIVTGSGEPAQEPQPGPTDEQLMACIARSIGAAADHAAKARHYAKQIKNAVTREVALEAIRKIGEEGS